MASGPGNPFGDAPKPASPAGPDPAAPPSKPVEPPVCVRPSAGEVAFAKSVARFLYCHNPFYVISAALVFWGLRISFDTTGRSFETDALMIGLVGYTLLLAAAACVIIRLGQVWNDARTILLLVVLMLLTISVTFDEALANNTRTGMWYYFGGLLLAVVVTETTLRVIRLRLPWLFRGPYYLAMAMFFLYPVAIAPLTRDPQDPKLLWAMFGFSPAAALVALALLPAVWRGPRYVRHNGSPWWWPLYPWTLFGTLALAAGGRSYYLCQSFHFVEGNVTIFRAYFLVPLLLAINVLLLEIGLRSRLKATVVTALFAPLAIVWLVFATATRPTGDFGFQQTFIDLLGATPQYLTLVLVAMFYCYAALRGTRGAVWGVTMAILPLAVVGRTNALDALVNPTGWPLVVAAVLQLGMAIERKRSAPCLLAAVLVLSGLAIDLRDTWFVAYHGAIPWHLGLLALLVIGAAYKDPFARFLRRAGVGAILLASLIAVVSPPATLGNPPATLLALYPIFAAIVAAAYSWLASGPEYLWAVAGSLFLWIVHGGWLGYQQLRHSVKGLDQIALGGVFLVVALVISLTKARRSTDRRK